MESRAMVLLGALVASVVGCSAGSGDPSRAGVGTTSSAAVPACEIDPYYCANEPFAVGAWRGDDGPFSALVLSNQLCSDRAFCFVGALADGTRIEGEYFDRPQLSLFSWSGGGQAFEGYAVQGDVLTFYAGPEGQHRSGGDAAQRAVLVLTGV